MVALGVAPDGAFIAIPSGGERRSLPVLRSVDGEAWTKVGVLPASKDGWIHAVASNSDVIVVTGGSSDATRPLMWVSADGTDWTAITAAHTNGLDIVDALAANSAGFVATQNGATGVAPWIGSAKGGEWDRVGSLTATLDAAMVDVTASGSGFVAVGRVGGVDGTAAAWLSSDGRVWTPATVADGNGRHAPECGRQRTPSHCVRTGRELSRRPRAVRFGRRRPVMDAHRWRSPPAVLVAPCSGGGRRLHRDRLRGVDVPRWRDLG